MGRRWLLVGFVFLLTACNAKAPYSIVADFPKADVRVIAVLPVEDMSHNHSVRQLLREKVWKDLYFKGYEKVPLSLVDEILAKNHQTANVRVGDIARLRDILKIDGAMRITLVEATIKYRLFWAQPEVAAVFELINATTGELLWRSQWRASRRCFGLSKGGMEMYATLAFEDTIDEVVEKIMGSFPDGDILPSPSKKKQQP